MNEEKFYRVNQLIKFSPIIVIDQHGKNLGSIPTAKARDIAIASGLDLVEISPNSRPPVCRIMDFGKFKFEQAIKEKKIKKKQQKVSQAKEVHLTSVIQDHDLQTKLKSAIKFLESGHKVNVKLNFRRREMAHQELGFKVIKDFISSLQESATVISNPKMDGRSIITVLVPKEEK